MARGCVGVRQRTAEDGDGEGLSEAERKKLKSKLAKAERKKAEEALRAEEASRGGGGVQCWRLFEGGVAPLVEWERR